MNHSINDIIVYVAGVLVADAESSFTVGHLENQLFLFCSDDVVMGILEDVQFVHNVVSSLAHKLISILQYPHFDDVVLLFSMGSIRLEHIVKGRDAKHGVAHISLLSRKRNISIVPSWQGCKETNFPCMLILLHPVVTSIEKEAHWAVSSKVVKLQPLLRHIPHMTVVQDVAKRTSNGA